MRSTFTDRRLEAIAGSPVVVTSEPIRWNATSLPVMTTGTVLFAGVYEYNPNEPSSGQAAIIVRDDAKGIPDTYIYLRKDPPERLSNFPGDQRGNSGQIWWGWLHIPTNVGTRNIGLGSHQIVTTGAYNWIGSMRGAAYDRLLTPEQAMAVIRSLTGGLTTH